MIADQSVSDIDVERPLPGDPGGGEQPPTRVRRGWLSLPNALTGLLLVVMSWFVISQGRLHGRTYDEYMQDDYGAQVLRFYLSRGEDRSFLSWPDYLYMPQHGSGFELIIAFFQHLTGEIWNTRTLVNGFFGVIGILLIALAGRELAGPWGGFAAGLGLALYPRYTGQMPNNSKDIPLTVAMLLVLWLVLRLMRRWSQKERRFQTLEVIAIGAAIGFAASIRVTALMWLGLLGLVALGFWLRQGRHLRGHDLGRELGSQVGAALVLATTSYLVMSLLWPYLLTNPSDGLKSSFETMAKYNWDHEILFAGDLVRSTDLPWDYAPWWLVVGSPLPVVLLTVAAAVAAVVALVRRQRIDGRLLLLGAYVAVPLALMIATHPTLYNGLRHFLFVVPGMLLLGSTLLVRWVQQLRTSGRAAIALALVVAAVLGQAEVVYSSARIYPYEYSYFSPLVGGYTVGRHNYESTYYGSCSRAAAVWLGENFTAYTTEPNPTFRDEHEWNTLAEVDLPDNFVSVGDGQPFFRITTDPPGPGYREIHDVMLEGEPLCRVSVADPSVNG